MIKINPFRIRSLLFVPAINEEFFKKILLLKGKNKPDAIIFDLEDSILPNGKVLARKMLKDYLVNNKEYKNKIYDKYIVLIRINDIHSKWFQEDLNLVNEINPNLLVLPKIESAKEIKDIKKKYKAKNLLILLETLKGIENSKEVLDSMDKEDIISLGYEDLSSQLLIERPENLDSINPISIIAIDCLIESKKHNLAIIDSVSRKFHSKSDLNNLKKECLFTSKAGFDGKLAIHPSQIPIINTIFAKDKLIKESKYYINKFNQLDKKGVMLNNKNEMIDLPSYKRYTKILAILKGN